MGERRIEHAYVFDRLGSERLPQAYRILMPQRRRRLKSGAAIDAEGGPSDEDRRDLCARLLGPAEGGADDRQPDQRAARLRRRARVSGP